MSERDDSRLVALAETALKLARSAPSGQLALARVAEAIDRSWIAEPWTDDLGDELAAAHEAACEPIRFQDIERALKDAWGTAPSRELDELQRDPVAVTPIAQIHRAMLDDQPVAIKVLRPALDARVRQDLVLLDALARPLGAALPGIDAGAMIAEVRARVLDELDLESEAETQRRVHRALRDHPTLHVAAPIGRLTHPTVLVTPWLAGVPFAETRGSERDRAGALYVAFVLGGAPFGLVHAAPTPGDALLLPDGRLAILDFGAMGITEPGRAKLTADAVDAVAGGDGPAFGRALVALGVLPAKSTKRAVALAAHALGPFGRPEATRLDTEALLSGQDRLTEKSADMQAVAGAATIDPADLWPLRGVLQVFGSVARGDGASADWLALARSALREGWDSASDIGRFLD